MDPQTLERICAVIYRRFPEVAGSQPKVQPRPGEQILLIFRAVSQTADGHKLSHTIRVVAGPDGTILKTTTSK